MRGESPFISPPDLANSERLLDGPCSSRSRIVKPGPGPGSIELMGDLSPDGGRHFIDANVALGPWIEIADSKAATRHAANR